jgi:hypothetical protein
MGLEPVNPQTSRVSANHLTSTVHNARLVQGADATSKAYTLGQSCRENETEWERKRALNTMLISEILLCALFPKQYAASIL